MATTNPNAPELREKMKQAAGAGADKTLARAGQGGAPAKVTPYQTMQGLLDKYKDEISEALPRHISPDRIFRMFMLAVRTNKDLLTCDAGSFLSAVITSAQLGLEPGILGECYLVPYNDRNADKKIVQFQVGYKGLVKLARQSGDIASINPYKIHEHDEFSVEYGTDGKIIHRPKFPGDRGKVLAYYIVVHFKDGGKQVNLMTVDDIEKHRQKYSQAPNSPAWRNNFDAMAFKTVFKQMGAWLPLSAEASSALAADESFRRGFDPNTGVGVDAPAEYPEEMVIEGEVVEQEDGSAVNTTTGEVLNNPDEPPADWQPGADGADAAFNLQP